MKTIERSTPIDWDMVEAAVAAFELSPRPDVESIAGYLPEVDHPQYLPVLRELLRADLEFAWRKGIRRRIETYRDLYPAIFTDPTGLREVAFEEYRLRCQANDPVDLEEYHERFGLELTESGFTRSEPSVLRSRYAVGNPEPTGRFDGIPSEAKRLANGHGSEGASPLSRQGFRIVRELGRGAFARVYLATQEELAGRLVVLKVSDQLVGESQTLARLQHTNIVPVYSSFRDGASHTVCMPYFGSTTLAEVLDAIRKQSSLPVSGHGIVSTVNHRKRASTMDATETPSEGHPEIPIPDSVTTQSPLELLGRMSHRDAALSIVADLADGLAHAHDRGILHRDLKPANVLISDEGRPMLLDFNLAFDSTTPDGQIVGGTPHYMSPEQLRSVSEDSPPQPASFEPRSDLYSLGLILFELLTGRLPDPQMSGSSRPVRERIAELCKLRSQPLPQSQLRHPMITPAIAAVLKRCLHPEPAGRYSSAHELREDLRRQLENRPLRYAREPFGRERLQKLIRRNPRLVSVPVLALFFVTFGVITYLSVEAARQSRFRTAALSTSQNLRAEFQRIRPVLLAPDSDPARMQSELDRIETSLAKVGLPDRPTEFHINCTKLLDDLERKRFNAELFETSLQLAHFRFAAAQTDIALKWNTIAERVAGNPGRLGMARTQRVRILKQLGLSNETDRVPPLEDTADDDPARILLQFAERFSARDYPAALECLQSSNPELLRRPDYWHAMGRTYAELEHWSDAVASYTTALSHQTDENALLRVHRGHARLALRDFPGAEADFDAAIRIMPEEPRNLVDRALARMGRSEFRGALDDLDRAATLWPGHTRIHFLKARILQRSGRTEEAKQTRDHGLALEPADEVSWVARGVARLREDPKGALADFDEALKLNPRSRAAQQNRANVYSERLNDPRKAIESLDTLLRFEPDSIPALAGRGVLHARLGQRKPAHDDARRVLAKQPTPFLRFQVAGIYALTSKNHPEDREEAMRLLASAFRDGFSIGMAEADPDLTALRDNPEFRSFIESAKRIEALSQNEKK